MYFMTEIPFEIKRSKFHRWQSTWLKSKRIIQGDNFSYNLYVKYYIKKINIKQLSLFFIIYQIPMQNLSAFCCDKLGG